MWNLTQRVLAYLIVGLIWAYKVAIGVALAVVLAVVVWQIIRFA